MSRILIDARLLTRPGAGIYEYTFQLIDHLLATPSSDQYLLFMNSVRSVAPPARWVEYENARMVNWRLPNRLVSLATRFFDYPRIDTATGADLVFSPHLDALSTERVPRIMAIHDLSFIHHPYFFTRRQRLWHLLQDYRARAARAAALVTDSHFTKGDIVATLGVAPENVHVIYPGIPEAFSRLPERGDVRACLKRYGIARPYVLYLGTVEPRKNVTLIVRAFSLIAGNRYELVIAGRKGWRYRETFEAIAASEARERIRYIGPVENDERPLLYTGASVFVYPSFFEGFGLPPLEAQACGCPVIAADRTSLPETLGASARFIDPWRTHELAAALERVLADATLRATLAKLGRENAQRFRWSAAVAQLKDLFASYV